MQEAALYLHVSEAFKAGVNRLISFKSENLSSIYHQRMKAKLVRCNVCYFQQTTDAEGSCLTPHELPLA